MKSSAKNVIQPDWWSKTLAGAILGFTLAVAIANIIVLIGLHFMPVELIGQFGMWAIPWFWLPIFFATYFISTGNKAILFLCLSNAVAYLCLFLIRD